MKTVLKVLWNVVLAAVTAFNTIIGLGCFIALMDDYYQKAIAENNLD